MSLYVVLDFDDMKPTAQGRFMRVVMNQAFATCRNTPLPSNRAKGRTLFVLDEVAQLGAMPSLQSAYQTLRSYNVKLWVFYQQYTGLAGQVKDTAAVTGNSTKQFFGCNDAVTAAEIEKYLGHQLHTDGRREYKHALLDQSEILDFLGQRDLVQIVITGDGGKMQLSREQFIPGAIDPARAATSNAASGLQKLVPEWIRKERAISAEVKQRLADLQAGRFDIPPFNADEKRLVGYVLDGIPDYVWVNAYERWKAEGDDRAVFAAKRLATYRAMMFQDAEVLAYHEILAKAERTLLQAMAAPELLPLRRGLGVPDFKSLEEFEKDGFFIGPGAQFDDPSDHKLKLYGQFICAFSRLVYGFSQLRDVSLEEAHCWLELRAPDICAAKAPLFKYDDIFKEYRISEDYSGPVVVKEDDLWDTSRFEQFDSYREAIKARLSEHEAPAEDGEPLSADFDEPQTMQPEEWLRPEKRKRAAQPRMAKHHALTPELEATGLFDQVYADYQSSWKALEGAYVNGSTSDEVSELYDIHARNVIALDQAVNRHLRAQEVLHTADVETAPAAPQTDEQPPVRYPPEIDAIRQRWNLHYGYTDPELEDQYMAYMGKVVDEMVQRVNNEYDQLKPYAQKAV